jgi:hypothetical protein
LPVQICCSSNLASGGGGPIEWNAEHEMVAAAATTRTTQRKLDRFGAPGPGDHRPS